MGLDYNIPHGSSGGTELLTMGVNLHCTPVEDAFPEEYGPPIWGGPIAVLYIVLWNIATWYVDAISNLSCLMRALSTLAILWCYLYAMGGRGLQM